MVPLEADQGDLRWHPFADRLLTDDHVVGGLIVTGGMLKHQAFRRCYSTDSGNSSGTCPWSERNGYG